MEEKISFTFQHQGKNHYYNLEVKDIHGKEHYFNSFKIEVVERKLKVIWGHLIEEKPEELPTPPGFPKPPS